MAPVLESLHLKLGRQCSEVDIGFWVRIAVEKGLCELDFDYEHYKTEPCRLPQSLFTCGTLTVLKLKNVSLKDVQFPVCFKLLKTLHLEYVIFLDKETPQKLLSSCPILEVFDLTRDDDDVDNVMSFSVMVPSLQRFIYCGGSGAELVMNTPSLKYLKLSGCGYECMIGNLPEIVEAHVEVACSTDDILTSLASVKRLLLCLPTEVRIMFVIKSNLKSLRLFVFFLYCSLSYLLVPSSTSLNTWSFVLVAQNGIYLCLCSNIPRNFDLSSLTR